MTIATVEGIHLVIPYAYGGPQPRNLPRWPQIHMLLVRIETESGLVGWGEAFGHLACATTKTALETLVVPLCVGVDASDITAFGERLRRALHVYGLDGAVLAALSGIDIALWDIRGKLEDKPLHRLLNPASNVTSVPSYASFLRYGDAELVGSAAVDAVSRGHRTVKLHEATIETVAAARERIGPEIKLTLDVNCRWSPDEAVEMAQRLKPYGLGWIEEPCWPPEPELLGRIGAASGTPMAAGENAGSLAELERIAQIGKARFLQPSAAKLGGLTALLAAREIASRHGALVAPHSAYFGPGLAVTIQFCAAFGIVCEWYDCRLEANPVGIAPRDGNLSVPQSPGLGFGVDMNVIKTYGVATNG